MRRIGWRVRRCRPASLRYRRLDDPYIRDFLPARFADPAGQFCPSFDTVTNDALCGARSVAVAGTTSRRVLIRRPESLQLRSTTGLRGHCDVVSAHVSARRPSRPFIGTKSPSTRASHLAPACRLRRPSDPPHSCSIPTCSPPGGSFIMQPPSTSRSGHAAMECQQSGSADEGERGVARSSEDQS